MVIFIPRGQDYIYTTSSSLYLYHEVKIMFIPRVQGHIYTSI
jgi:hypothetical protein